MDKASKTTRVTENAPIRTPRFFDSFSSEMNKISTGTKKRTKTISAANILPSKENERKTPSR